MSTHRAALLRAVFDQERDRIWLQALEPKFKNAGASPVDLARCRQEWDRQSREKDWQWWTKYAQRFSDAQLEDLQDACRTTARSDHTPQHGSTACSR